MPPKGTNSKKEAGRAKKAENEAKKKEAAAANKERQEAEKWAEGAKSSKVKETKEEKRRAEAARKAESARLLAEEEASLPNKVKAAPKAGAKKTKAQTPAGPGAIAAGGNSEVISAETEKEKNIEDFDKIVESFQATGLDDALELLEVINAKSDKASVGQQAAGLERHPERRFKAAFEAYQERELPKLKEDHPGLRLQQYKDLLYKQFQKSPENPFNQTVIAYDATKAEKLEALRKKKEEVEERLREKSGSA